MGEKTLGFFGVAVFFILSGWLISVSWMRDPKPGRFLLKRCLRIFPALAVVILGSAFILGPTFTSLSLKEYFSSPLTWTYLLNIPLWIHHQLPGVFENNPYPQAINGSLWTLPVEFGLYLSVLFAGLLGIFRNWQFPYLALLTLCALSILGFIPHGSYFETAYECLILFWWGIAFGFERSADIRSAPKLRSLLFVSLILLAFGLKSIEFPLLLTIAFALIWLASKTGFGGRAIKRLGDLSYGMYIFAFLVQQSLIAWMGPQALPFWGYFTLSLLITFLLSLLSWHLIEKRALLLKPSAKKSVF